MIRTTVIAYASCLYLFGGLPGHSAHASSRTESFLREQLRDYGYNAQSPEDVYRAMEAPQAIVRSIAILLAGETRDTAAIPRIAAALKDEDLHVRIDAARTLINLGDKRGTEVLKSIVAKCLPEKPPPPETIGALVGRCEEFWTVLDALLGLAETGDVTYAWAAEWAALKARLAGERSRATRVLKVMADTTEEPATDRARRAREILLTVSRTEKDPGVLLEVTTQAGQCRNRALRTDLLTAVSRSTAAPPFSRRHAAALLSTEAPATAPSPTSFPSCTEVFIGGSDAGPQAPQTRPGG